MKKFVINKHSFIEYVHFILALFVLGWLNINTFIYGKIPGIIKISIYVIWFLIACKKKYFFKKNCIYAIPIIGMYLFTFLGDNNYLIETYRQNFMYMFMIFSIYTYYSDEKYSKFRKFILVFLIIDFVYIGINTYIELLKNPLVARYMSTAAEKQTKYLEGVEYNNIGTYGFFYSLVMLVLIFLHRLLSKTGNIIVNIIMIAFLTILLIQGRFTISLILLIICSISMVIFYRKKDYNNKLYLKLGISTFIIIIVAMNITNILSGIIEIEGIPEEISIRVNEIRNRLISGESSEGTDLEARSSLYQKSLDCFKSNILVGVMGDYNAIGRHSTLLDFLGLYGIFSFLAFYYIYNIYKDIKKYCNKSYIISIIFIYYILLSLINTSLFPNIFITLFIIVPFYVKEGQERIEENERKNTSNVDSKYNISISG